MKPSYQDIQLAKAVARVVTGKSLQPRFKKLGFEVTIEPFKDKETELAYKQALGRYIRNHKALNENNKSNSRRH